MSGCRLRDVAESPEANVSAFVVDEGGRTGTWYTHPVKAYARPTSEFNSHLAVHNDQVAIFGLRKWILVDKSSLNTCKARSSDLRPGRCGPPGAS